MVLIEPPPPQRQPDPVFYTLSAGDRLIRIFDPTRYNTNALTFRDFGPLGRFDHHRSKVVDNFPQPDRDPERGIYYAALTFSGCLVEVFGDPGIVEVTDRQVAYPILTRDLSLLDLRRSGAMRSGSVAALSKVAMRSLSQAWSRYFYESEEIYTHIDGIIYLNAHNDEDAIALYERARDAIVCPPEQVMPLRDDNLRPAILDAAIQNNLIVIPY